MQGAQRCRSTILRVIQVILCDPNGQKVGTGSSQYHTRISPPLSCTAVAAHFRPAVINLCQLRCRQPFGRGFCCRCAVRRCARFLLRLLHVTLLLQPQRDHAAYAHCAFMHYAYAPCSTISLSASSYAFSLHSL